MPLQLPIKLHTPPSPVIQPPPPPPPPPPGQTVATLSKLTTGKARPSKLRKGKRTARLKLTKQGKKTLRGKSSITLKLVAQRTDGGPKLTKTLPFN